MANIKISQLPAATTLAGDTLLEVVQNGENKKATLNAIQTLTTESITAQRTALSINNVDNTSDANKPVSTAQQTALDGKAATSHTHPATQISDSTTAGRALLTAADVAAQRTALSINNVDNTSDANKPVSTAQQTALNGKANTTHTHAIADVTGLQTALDGKAATSHTHPATQISDSTTAGRALLTAADVAAQRTALSINNVDNTSDANKPVSTAQQTALNGKANTTHSHAIADVTGLQTALDGKAATSHTHPATQISDSTAAGRALLTAVDAAAQRTALSINNVDNTSDANKPVSTAQQTALNGKANTTHSHAIADVTGLQTALDGKAEATSLTFGTNGGGGTANLIVSDAGRMIYLTGAGVLTIPSGNVFLSRQFCMLQAGAFGLTITPAGGVTLRVAGTGLTGAYVLSPNGLAFLMKHAWLSDEYYIWPSLGTADSPTFSNVSDSKGNLRDLPVTNRTAAYTAALSDTGGTIRTTGGGVTVPSGVFSAGQAFSIFNRSGSSQTITQASGVTMYLSGPGTTGNRTLAPNSICTVYFTAANECVISGAVT
jgi:hypothetical protein